MSDLQTRDFKIAPTPEAEDAPRTVRGLAVPYGVENELFDGYFETIAPGALAPPHRNGHEPQARVSPR